MKLLIDLFKAVKENPLFIPMVVLPLAIVGKNLIGAGLGIISDDWHPEYLKRGLLKGLFVYAGVAVFAIISTLSDQFGITLNGQEYTLISGMVIIITAWSALYVAQGIELLIKVSRVKTTEGEIENE